MIDAQRITLVVTASSGTTTCPVCTCQSSSVHSHYYRTIADVPLGRRPVRLRLRVHRFRCCNQACHRQIFAERIPLLVADHARRTQEQRAMLEEIALALGGQAGAALAERLGVPASRNTLLRLLRALVETAAPTPRVLGVDDWSRRKGRTYATILVDLERRRPVDLLPDRTR